mmetsp:Transcript_54122/g.105909  ORF Transcript_54122/g.105909 Transcript_54122/m.105909 type:complete len:272 (-) Transcript_54122:118-933(-)
MGKTHSYASSVRISVATRFSGQFARVFFSATSSQKRPLSSIDFIFSARRSNLFPTSPRHRPLREFYLMKGGEESDQPRREPPQSHDLAHRVQTHSSFQTRNQKCAQHRAESSGRVEQTEDDGKIGGPEHFRHDRRQNGEGPSVDDLQNVHPHEVGPHPQRVLRKIPPPTQILQEDMQSVGKPLRAQGDCAQKRPKRNSHHHHCPPEPKPVRSNSPHHPGATRENRPRHPQTGKRLIVDVQLRGANHLPEAVEKRNRHPVEIHNGPYTPKLM